MSVQVCAETCKSSQLFPPPRLSSAGSLCDIKLDPCSSGPCQNGGRCRAVSGGGGNANYYECRCPDGFEGPSCEVNNADHPYMTSANFFGFRTPPSCLNFTQAVNKIWQFFLPPQYGPHLWMVPWQRTRGSKSLHKIHASPRTIHFFQRDIDECSLSVGQCQNGGECRNEIGSFECDCLDGFKGNLIPYSRFGLKYMFLRL